MKRIDVMSLGPELEKLVEHLGDGMVLLERDGVAVAVLKQPGPNTDLIGSLRDELQIVGDVMTTDTGWEPADGQS
jgi:hypothetical protein